jgi:hypothetical protein
VYVYSCLRTIDPKKIHNKTKRIIWPIQFELLIFNVRNYDIYWLQNTIWGIPMWSYVSHGLREVSMSKLLCTPWRCSFFVSVFLLFHIVVHHVSEPSPVLFYYASFLHQFHFFPVLNGSYNYTRSLYCQFEVNADARKDHGSLTLPNYTKIYLLLLWWSK